MEKLYSIEEIKNALHKAELQHNKNYTGIWNCMENYLSLLHNPQIDNYEWLKNATTAYIQGSVGFPVLVNIDLIDMAAQKAHIRTEFQNGDVDFSRLYKTEAECPTR